MKPTMWQLYQALLFAFHNQNILQHAEQCNGSGDCRKTPASGGTMCPSFMATRNEKETTRARANILREYLTNDGSHSKDTMHDSYGRDAMHSVSTNIKTNAKEVKEVLDLCLMCKGCKNECPSNVDMAKLKMEFMHQYYTDNGVPIRSQLVANFSKLSHFFSYIPWAYNLVFDTPFLRKISNNLVGFHPDRTMPLLAKQTFHRWFSKNETRANENKKIVNLFVDEFTNYNDVEIGIKAVNLLQKLGYKVVVPQHVASGRPQLSKAMLNDAKKLANENVTLLSDKITENTPLIGIEPSAILTFRDEYPDLV